METRQTSLDELLAVLTQIPEMQQLNDVTALQARIGERPYLALVAYRQQQPLACKAELSLKSQMKEDIIKKL
jgi:hypothetical protein